MNALGHLFCEEAVAFVKEHIRRCAKCRKGILSIIEELPPFFSLLIPANVKQYLSELKED